MVVILTAETGAEFCAAHERWTDALELGRRYGWRPRGTVRPSAWDGGYERPCGQMIASADARHLADALAAALADVPDHEARPAARAPNAFEAFSGRRKPQLAALAGFLGSGACTIFGACDSHRAGRLALE